MKSAAALLTAFTVIFIAGFFPAAAEAASKALSPASRNWPVTTVTLDDGTPPYCAMRNEFRDANIALIFSRDASDNMSLALDFSENLLDEGGRYALSLIIPGQASRRILAEAVNSRILVAQMGPDFDFLRSFARGETLRVQIPGAHLTLALRGTLKSVEQFHRCTKNLPPQDSGSRRAAVDSAPPSASVSSPPAPPALPDIRQEPEQTVEKPVPVPPQTGTPPFASVAVQQMPQQHVPQQQQVPVPQPQITEPAPHDRLEALLQSALRISALDTRHREEGIYSWREGELFGNAQIFNWTRGKSFTDMIAEYFARAQTRCSGDFAYSTENATALSGGHIYASGNIACIGDNLDSAAAVFFHGHGDLFTVISHESGSRHLDKAVALRDRIAGYMHEENNSR